MVMVGFDWFRSVQDLYYEKAILLWYVEHFLKNYYHLLLSMEIRLNRDIDEELDENTGEL